jgi:hypothetical protein
LFIPVAIIVCFFLVLPRRNNFFTLPVFLALGLVSNLAFTKFYDLTWLFYPRFHSMSSNTEITGKWISAGSWSMGFLIVAIIIYVFLSSSLRLMFKKTYALACFIAALLFASLASYLLLFIMPLSFTFPRTEIDTKIDSSVTIEFQNPKTPSNLSPQITSAQSATQFFVYASGLSPGKRYGMRMLSPEQTVMQEKSNFYYCRNRNCRFELGQANAIGDRLEPGVYTVQVLAQQGDELIVVAERKIEITALVIAPYSAGADYPCEMWLTLGNNPERLLRIDADSQEMTDIGVWAQCDKAKTYDAQIEVGTLSQEIQYYTNTIYPSDSPFQLMGLGGNTSHGYVRLIIDNQIMGEAIIDRGFPICDDGKIVEGGEDSNCVKEDR